MSHTRELERAAARMMCVGFDGVEVTPALRELVSRGVRSVILFSRNYQSLQQLAELCREVKSLSRDPILICVDQEGGRVQRFREPFTRIPPMRELGRNGDEAAVRAIGNTLARELRAVNIDMNLAPVLDVDSNPKNPVIGDRSFSSDPRIVARLGCALIDGLQSTTPTPHAVAACGKHFPGHGDTDLDSHYHLPRLNHDWDRLHRIELPPFIAAIKRGVASIMVSHVLFKPLDVEWPTSMSKPIITGLLRDKLGFEGVVVSDDLEMKAIADHFGINQAVTRGARAGVDLFCICHDAERQNGAMDELSRAIHDDGVLREHAYGSANRQDRLADRFVRPALPWSEASLTAFENARSAEPVRGICSMPSMP